MKNIYKKHIKKLDISNKNLINLQNLSDYTNLEELLCVNNKFTSLENLPNTLIKLNCNSNKLTTCSLSQNLQIFILRK